MRKEVLVSMSGLQFEVDKDEPIEIISVGEYYNRNNKHYVLYEEILEDMEGVSNCTLKISGNQLEVIKRGTSNIHMIFQENKMNTTLYNTPFGDIQIGIFTTDIETIEEEDKIMVTIKYSLDVNFSHISDCEIQIKITSRNGHKYRDVEAEEEEQTVTE